MNKIFLKLIAAVIIISAVLLIPQICLALSGDFYIPGDTEEEWNINEVLLTSNDENALISYLSNDFASVRMTAANRLGKIGTSASLTRLEEVATIDSDYRVKDVSSLSLWYIRYRECISGGSDWAALLLSIFTDDADVTKTAYVKVWAMGILGGKGCAEALPALQAILDDTEFNPYGIILKEAASGMKALINFQNSFDASTDPMVIIEQGLSNAELAIRKWSLYRLVELKPADLMDRLNTLLRQASVNDDTGFLPYIARAIDKEEEYNRYPPLEIVYPQDGDTVKTPSIKVIGYSYGRQFDEDVSLVPGANTYTKTVTRDGVTTSESITIYYVNNPPALANIGNRNVLPGQTLTFTLSATDPDPEDTDILYFTDPYPLPERMSFDYATHTFTYAPTAADIGSHSVTFMVDDGYGLRASETVTMTVIGGNVVEVGGPN
ncbi:MAG: HEAT repeat domain-containing protein, partial [Candidatus Omnitrophota bacterium]